MIDREIAQPQVISIMSYNLQRLGDLAPKKERKRSRQKKLECLQKTIQETQARLAHPLELFAFQEVNNHNLNLIEETIGLTCQHVGYHSQNKRLGGLGICVKSEGSLKLNYVRNVTLKGKGRWRALFAEVSFAQQQHSTFNVLNVHFLPHGVDTENIKRALLSPESTLGLVQGILDTSATQRDQAEGLLTLIQDYRDPTILMGDFNSPPHTGAHPLLREKWVDVWEASGTNFGATKYFGGLIPFRIDFIYALKGAFETLESRVTPESCSDHRSVVATLQLKPR